MLIACAVVGDVAAMARRSSVLAPGIVSRVQCAPPSSVCTTVPRWPLAHTTLADTTLNPRSPASVGLDCGCHCADTGVEPATTQARNETSARTRDRGTEWRVMRDTWSMPAERERDQQQAGLSGHATTGRLGVVARVRCTPRGALCETFLL